MCICNCFLCMFILGDMLMKSFIRLKYMFLILLFASFAVSCSCLRHMPENSYAKKDGTMISCKVDGKYFLWNLHENYPVLSATSFGEKSYMISNSLSEIESVSRSLLEGKESEAGKWMKDVRYMVRRYAPKSEYILFSVPGVMAVCVADSAGQDRMRPVVDYYSIWNPFSAVRDSSFSKFHKKDLSEQDSVLRNNYCSVSRTIKKDQRLDADMVIDRVFTGTGSMLVIIYPVDGREHYISNNGRGAAYCHKGKKLWNTDTDKLLSYRYIRRKCNMLSYSAVSGLWFNRLLADLTRKLPERKSAADMKYMFRDDIENKYDGDSTLFGYQMKATDYSINGFYGDALEVFDHRLFSVPEKDLKSFLPDEWECIDARKYIIEKSKNEKVMVINEVHHCSRNRNFTASLLEELYEEGYRYLGLEALVGFNDSVINRRGFVTWGDGYYTREPEFGNLINKALSIGYAVFGYEAANTQTAAEREYMQMSNIMNFISSHSDGKVLIHCGYDHVNEYKGNSSGYAMAGLLKASLGYDIFTVKQTLSVEGRLPVPEKTEGNMPVVLKSRKDGRMFNGISNQKTDICVVYPPTEYIERNRPQWQTIGRRPYKPDKSGINEFPVLVHAYRLGEREYGGVPADIVEADNEYDDITLYLSPGNYEIVMFDRDYKILVTDMVEVK